MAQRRQVVFDEALHLGGQLGVGGDAGFFDFAQLVVHLPERFPQRLHQLVDRLLARRQIAFGAFLELLQCDRRKLDEGLVVAPERVGGERLEGVCELLLRVVEERELLRGGLALLGQAGIQLGKPRVALGELVGTLGDRALQAGHPDRRHLCRRAALGFVAQLVRHAGVLGLERLEPGELLLHRVQPRAGDCAPHDPRDDGHRCKRSAGDDYFIHPPASRRG